MDKNIMRFNLVQQFSALGNTPEYAIEAAEKLIIYIFSE